MTTRDESLEQDKSVKPEADQVNTQGKEDKLLDSIKAISDHAKGQVDAAYKAYSLMAKLITGLFVFGLGVGAFLTYRSLHEMRQDITGQIDAVSKRVDRELELDEIKKIIEEKVDTKVSKITDKVIDERVKKALPADEYL